MSTFRCESCRAAGVGECDQGILYCRCPKPPHAEEPQAARLGADLPPDGRHVECPDAVGWVAVAFMIALAAAAQLVFIK